MQGSSHPDRSFPRLHKRPAAGWLNDPNGIHHRDGRWHVAFQFNPASARHEHIVWGHMSSPDLLRWQEHPIALRPREGQPDAFGCWSGVATFDEDVPVLVYSGVRAGDGRSEVVLARPAADGDRWVQDDRVATGMPDDPAVVMVRDPFLFEFDGRRWAVQGAGLASGQAAILLYDATDLRAWNYRGVLLSSDDEVAATAPHCNVWECPQLFPVGDDWVLIVSLWRPEQLLCVAYLIGDMERDPDTALPRFRPRVTGILDDGVSFYAPQAVLDRDTDRVLLWGWAREVTAGGVRPRTPEEIDAAGWSGSLTFPREVAIHDGIVALPPARELTGLRGEMADPAQLPDQAEVLVEGVGRVRLHLRGEGGGDQVIWEQELHHGNSTRILIDASVIEICPERGTSRVVRAYPAADEFYCVTADPGVSVVSWQLRVPH